MNKKGRQNYKKGKYFVVENILQDKIENGNRKFLVKWQNYSEACNTWVEEEDLSRPDLILEYESRKRSQLKRKMKETIVSGPSSKRQKGQETLVDATIAEELFEIKAKLNNIENLLDNLTNEFKKMKKIEVANPSMPPPPPPMHGLVQPKKLQTVQAPKFDGVLKELNEIFKRGPIQLKKVDQKKANEPLIRQMNAKKLKPVEEFQTLKLKKTPQLPVGNKFKK